MMPKVVLFGCASVGKTTLLARMKGEAFDSHRQSTIGAAMSIVEYQINRQYISFNVWDTAGQERFESMMPMYLRGAAVVLYCFDSYTPEHKINKHLATIRETGNKLKIFMVMTKTDLCTTLPFLADNIKKKMHIYYTSSLDGTGYQELLHDMSIFLYRRYTDYYEGRANILDSGDEETIMLIDQEPPYDLAISDTETKKCCYVV
jgi:small GTP-binding protein